MEQRTNLPPKELGLRVRADGIDLQSEDAPLKIFDKMTENAQTGKDMDVPAFLDDLRDLKITGALENPAMQQLLLKVGQNPLIWLGQFDRIEATINSGNLTEVQENLELASLLGMDQASADPRKQVVADQINIWNTAYAEIPLAVKVPTIEQASSPPPAPEPPVPPPSLESIVNQIRELEQRSRQGEHVGSQFFELVNQLSDALKLPENVSIDATRREDVQHDQLISGYLSDVTHIRDLLEKQPEFFHQIARHASPELQRAFAGYYNTRAGTEPKEWKYSRDQYRLQKELMVQIDQEAGITLQDHERVEDTSFVIGEAHDAFIRLVNNDDSPPTTAQLKEILGYRNQSLIENTKSKKAILEKRGKFFDDLATRAGLIILYVSYQGVTYTEKASGTTEKKLSPKALTQLETALGRLRKPLTTDEERDSLRDRIEELLNSNLARQEGFLTPQQKFERSQPYNLFLSGTNMHNPEQVQMLQQIFDRAPSSDLREAFNLFKQRWDAYQAGDKNSGFIQASEALEDLIDQKAYIGEIETEEYRQKSNRARSAGFLFDCLLDTGVNKISMGEIIEGFIDRERKEDEELEIKQRLQGTRTRAWEDMAKKAGLKVTVRQRRSYQESSYPGYLWLARRGPLERLLP